MSYLLLHNLEEYTYNNILESYKKDGYIILYKEKKDTLIKKSDLIIKDEDIYIKVLFSQLNKNKLINESKGLVIDITKHFFMHIRRMVLINLIIFLYGISKIL